MWPLDGCSKKGRQESHRQYKMGGAPIKPLPHQSRFRLPLLSFNEMPFIRIVSNPKPRSRSAPEVQDNHPALWPALISTTFPHQYVRSLHVIDIIDNAVRIVPEE